MGSPIAELYGPGEIGVFINVFLYGVIVSQVWSYYSKYQNDPVWLKIYIRVGVLMFADSLNTLFTCWWIFDLTIMQFGNLAAFENGKNWLIACDPAMGGIIAFYCQAFYAWRLKVLTGNKWLAAIVFVLGFCVMVGGVAIAIALGIQLELSDINAFRAIVYLWLIPAVVADLIISVSLTYYLRRRRPGFSKTADILNKIIRLTVQSCFLTTLCSLGDLISYLSTPKGIHISFSLALPKLYSNSVLSSLNSRSRMSNVRDWEDQTISSGCISFSETDVRPSNTFGSGVRARTHGGVHVLSRGNGGTGEVITLQAQPTRGHTAVFVDVETETHVAADGKSRSIDEESAIRHSTK